jgi:uncharacterized protein YabE (DUF348 family)
LYGAVIAGVVSGTVAWQGIDKTVHLVVDGNASTVHTTADRVADILHGKGYTVGPHDIVAPAASATVRNGGRIVFARGRLLHLDVNGVHEDVWTTAPTVADALAQLGYGSNDFTSVSRSMRLPLSPTDLMIRTPISVSVQHDGRTDHLATTDVTVGQLIKDLGLALGKGDSVKPPTGKELVDGMQIVVHRTVKGQQVTNQVIPFQTTKIVTASLAPGQVQVVTPGVTGEALVAYEVVWVDGKVFSRTKVGSSVVKAPVTQVEKVGPPAAAPSAPPSGLVAACPPPSSGTASQVQAQDIARCMLAKQGDSDQFTCLANIWDNESGWRVTAGNASGAYGIPQALPGWKMGDGWQTNASVQINWGLGYIAARYGTPCGAWSFWQAHHWY